MEVWRIEKSPHDPPPPPTPETESDLTGILRLRMVNLVPLVESPLPYAIPRRPSNAAPAVEAALSILETLGTAHELGVTDLEEARPGHELRLPVVGDPGEARVPGEEPADRPVPAHPPALRRRDVDHRRSVAAVLTSSVSSPRLPDQLLRVWSRACGRGTRGLTAPRHSHRTTQERR
jgi:hypothetical protein